MTFELAINGDKLVGTVEQGGVNQKRTAEFVKKQ
jgi:hypothetical protein